MVSAGGVPLQHPETSTPSTNRAVRLAFHLYSLSIYTTREEIAAMQTMNMQRTHSPAANGFAATRLGARRGLPARHFGASAPLATPCKAARRSAVRQSVVKAEKVQHQH